MRLEELLPDAVRARYSLKLLCISLGIVALITAVTATTAIGISERVQTEQLTAIETNAELEARALGQWIDGKRQTVRVLSNHEGIVAGNRSRTQTTLETEIDRLSRETASLSVVERQPETFSNGTTETVLASTEAELVGQPLRATDANWKPDVGFNFEDASDVVLSWVYTDDSSRTFVALATPTADGERVLVAEYRTSVRAEQFTSAVAGTETLVVGGFTGYVLFDENESSGIVPYESDRENTTIGQTILRAEPTASLAGAVLTDTAVKGYHSVPGDSVDWVVVKEVPRTTALALTDRVRNDLWLLVGVMLGGFFLVGVVIQRGPIRSIKRLARQANAIAEGDLDADIEQRGRIDEVGEVRSAFSNTKAYIETITKQADALSSREFDSDALDEAIPGRVGTAMATMQRDLRTFITRLEVFNRVLRHNLRNRLDVVDSHAEALDDETASDHPQAILEAADRLAALGDRARRIDRLMSRDLDPEEVDLAGELQAVLDDIETDEAISVTTDLPADAPLVTDREALRTVLRSPLENAVTYADTAIEVRVEATDDGYAVEIGDDGPGIPEAELEVLAADRETQLQHGRGLGLWQLKWGVAELDGDFEVTTDDGTTVRIRLPDLDDA